MTTRPLVTTALQGPRPSNPNWLGRPCNPQAFHSSSSRAAPFHGTTRPLVGMTFQSPPPQNCFVQPCYPQAPQVGPLLRFALINKRWGTDRSSHIFAIWVLYTLPNLPAYLQIFIQSDHTHTFTTSLIQLNIDWNWVHIQRLHIYKSVYPHRLCFCCMHFHVCSIAILT